MAKAKSMTLKEEPVQETGGAKYHWWKFKNPKGRKVRCEAIAGTGEIYLYKNNVLIGPRYQISAEPGPPTAVHLNTGSWMERRTITIQEDDTLLKISRKWGVPVKKLLAENELTTASEISPGQQLTIPDSSWQIWIKEMGSGENEFCVTLLSE